jgi:hypothetical protein
VRQIAREDDRGQVDVALDAVDLGVAVAQHFENGALNPGGAGACVSHRWCATDRFAPWRIKRGTD